MKYISSFILRSVLFVLFPFCLVASVSAQTPTWGAFWEGNDGDHIVMDKYTATDAEDPWYYSAARTFLRIRAWNTNRTTHNYIQLFFWIEDWDNFTTSYADGIGPKEGAWQMNTPYVFIDGYGNPYWRLGFEKEGNIYDQLNKCVIGYDPNIDYICAYSSYGANASNTTDTYEGDWDKEDITSFTDYSVKVSVGEGGNIYIEIGSPSGLVATIGKKFIDNSVFINLNTDIDFEDNTASEDNAFLRLTGNGSGSNGQDYEVQLCLNWNHTTGTFSESDINFEKSYFRTNGKDIICTSVTGTVTETSPGTYQLIATLVGEDGTVFSVVSNYAHCPKPEEFTGGTMASFSVFNDDDVIQVGTAKFSTNVDLDNWHYDGYYDSRDYNKFWVIKARSNSQEYNYIQLYFWVDTDNLYTYKDGYQCVKPGTYHFQAPSMETEFTYYGTTYYAWYVNEQYYNKCALGLTRDSYWGVCPYSSYIAKGWSQYFDPNYNSVTSMNMATVVVKEGKGGHIYIEIWVTPSEGKNPVLAVTINEPKHAGVDTYQLNVYQTGNGRVEFPTQECNYVEGEEIVLTPYCEDGFEFDGWTGDCADQIRDNGDGTYTFTMGTKDCSLTANCKEIKETVTVEDNVNICAGGFPFVWRPWSNGGNGFEITSAAQAGTIKDEVKKDGVTILEDSIVTLKLTVHEPQTVEVKDTIWQCEFDLGDGNFINLVLPDETELDIANATGNEDITYEETEQDRYGCDSTTIHKVIIIPEKVEEVFDFCQSDFIIGPNDYINLVLDDGTELEGAFWGTFSGDSVILNDTVKSTYCEDIDSVTIRTVRIYPAYRETWNPGYCADEIEEKLAEGIAFFGIATITDWSQNGMEYYTDGSINGCDSVIVLDLTPIPNDTINETVQIHEFPYSYKGKTFNSLKDTLFIKTPQKDGCNIYTKLIPEFVDTLKTEFYEIGCSQFTWEENGKTYTESGNDTIFLRSYDDKLDSIVVLHLTIELPKIGIDTTATACSSFVWYGTEYSTSGDYTKDLRSAAGCDSTVTLHLTINHPTVTEERVTACMEYEWYGEPLTVSGDYKHILPENADGCVDTLVLHLTIATPPAPVDLGTIMIGIGNAYTVFEGTPYEQRFDTDGPHTAIGKTIASCDSVVNLSLVVIKTLEEDVYDTICLGDKLEWNGEEYGEAGDYDYETQNAIGIDSIAHLHLTVNLPTSSETEDAGCAPYTWFGQNYFQSSDYEHHLINAAGCDSTITLHLTIYPSYNVTDGATVCPNDLPYTVNGVTFTEADTYTAIDSHYKQATKTMTLPTIHDCDSVVTFTLTVQTPTNDIQTETACDNQLPFQWNPTAGYTQDLYEGGTYNHTLKSSLGCDSIYYTLNLTIDRNYVAAQPTLTPLETCANDEALQIVLNSTTGTPAAYDITFDDRAAAQGLTSVSHQTIPADNIIAIPLPKNEDSTVYVRPDDYSLTLTVYDQCDRRTDYPLLFRILYPSWLIQQRWRDVLALYNEKYNGGYTFSIIRWYKNGAEITGQGVHNSYIQMSPVLEMATYYALLTRADDGKSLRTCDFVPNLASPYYAPEGEKIRLVQQTDSRHITVKTDLSGTYRIYDVTGKQIMNGYFGEEYGSPAIVFSSACTDGAYIIHFQANDGTEDTKKWLIR